MSNEQAIENEIQAKGLNAPRLTPTDIDAAIESEHYFTARDAVGGDEAMTEAGFKALGLLTFCVLVLRNGFTVTGESACASPENFDPEIGRKSAREKARNKIWPLEGYLLRQRLYEKASPAEELQTTRMTLGQAIEAMIAGQRVARAGWNGEGMWLYHVPASSYLAATDAARASFGDFVPYGAYIAMRTAQGNVVPWLASQTDMLADDWQIIEGAAQ